MRIVLLAALLTLLFTLESWRPLAAPRATSRSRASNLSLWLLVVALNLLLAFLATGTLLWAERTGLGFLRVLPERLPGWLTLAVAVVLLDLVTWLVHVALHRSPAAWRVHRVHHNDPAIDVTTALRQHPIETVLRTGAQTLTALAAGIGPGEMTIAVTISAVAALFGHANLRLPERIEQALGRVLVTPRMHRLHHARAVELTDSNYGNIFPWWDRLGATLRRVPAPEQVSVGLDGFDAPDDQTLRGMLSLPWRSPRT